MTVHVQCGAEWEGINTCHCANCHVTFSGEAAFTAHRAGPNRKDATTRGRIAGVCASPTAAGMVDAGREYPCWGFVTRETRDRGEGGRLASAS